LRADLVLWVKEEGGPRAVAHCRPAPGSTVYYEDPIGTLLEPGQAPELLRLLDGAAPTGEPISIQREGREATGLLVPVRKDGGPLAGRASERPLSDTPRSVTERRWADLRIRRGQ